VIPSYIITVREYFIDFGRENWQYSRTVTFKNGNRNVKYTPHDIGALVRDTRKRLGVTQKDLALTAGTGLRFVIDLERGKETCELGKSLRILQTLGIALTLTPPAGRA
jgi:y4mF family transcriptional regulator